MEEYVFGSYIQSDKKDPVEWLILKKENGKALLISKCALEAKPFNTSFDAITWENCSLRRWLNNDFYNTAFTEDEKERILVTDVKAKKNSTSTVEPGNDTQDRIFLLSVDESEELFSSDEARTLIPTPYSAGLGVYINGSNGSCWWWLRSPGIKPNYAAHVSTFGNNYPDGCNANVGNGAVRPAMWIKL